MKINSSAYQEAPPGFQPMPHILLHPQIPKPMHGLAPRTILGQAWWDNERQAAYAKYNQHCWACGVHRDNALPTHWLEAHEMYDINYESGTMQYVFACALCTLCHKYIHFGKLTEDCKIGKVTPELLLTVKKHGRSLLSYAEVLGKAIKPRTIAPWSSWRLILDGREYPGLWPSYEAWKAHYSSAED